MKNIPILYVENKAIKKNISKDLRRYRSLFKRLEIWLICKLWSIPLLLDLDADSDFYLMQIRIRVFI
jgi:hypothetical protein